MKSITKIEVLGYSLVAIYFVYTLIDCFFMGIETGKLFVAR